MSATPLRQRLGERIRAFKPRVSASLGSASAASARMFGATGALSAKPLSVPSPDSFDAASGLALGIAIGAGLTMAILTLTHAARKVRRRDQRSLSPQSRFDDLALASLGDLSFAIDARDPEVIECDRRANLLLGYQPESSLSSSELRCGFEDWMHADDIGKFRDVAAALAAGQPQRVLDWEFRCRSADGSWRWLRATHLTTERDDAGQPIRHRGFAVDVTRRKAADLERSRVERRFQRLSETFPGALCRCRLRTNGELEFEYLSPSAGRLFGHEPEALLADSSLIWRKTVADDLDRMRPAIAESARNRWAWDGEFRLREVDGRVRWLRLWLTPDISAQRMDGVIGDSEVNPNDPLWNGVLIDETSRLEAEAELERIADLASDSPDGWARFDAKLHPIWVNRSLRLLLELDEDQPIPEDLLDRMCPDWTLRLIEEEGLPQLAERGLWLGEAALRKSSGMEVPVSLLWAAKPSPHGGGIEEFAVSVRDNSRRKRRDQELLGAIERLENSSRAKDRFLAGMGRTLREPLFSAIGGLNLLKMLETPDQRHTVLALVERNADQIRNALDHLLDFARLRQTDSELERQPIAPWSLIREIAAEFADQQRAAGTGLTLKASAKTPLPRRVQTDAERFRQVVARSLAWRAIRKGHDETNPAHLRSAPSIVIGAALESDVDIPAGHVAGPEDAPRFQLRLDLSGPPHADRHWEIPLLGMALNLDDPTLADHCQDDGFELIIARAAAESLGGSIVWRSEEDCLTIRLPISAEDASALEACKEIDSREASATSAKDKGNAGHILLVEDNPDHRKILSHYLEAAGFRIDAASNGREGAEKALAQPFDAILMDIDLPLINGQEAARLLRVNGVATPVLAMTASALPEERLRCLNAGCVECLVKPVTRDALVRALNAAIHPLGARSLPPALQRAALAASSSSPVPISSPVSHDSGGGEWNDSDSRADSPFPIESESDTDLEVTAFDPETAQDEGADAVSTSDWGSRALDSQDETGLALAEESMDDSYGFDLDDELWQDPEFQEMVREFARSLPSRLVEVKQAWERDEIDSVESIAHQLKGAGGMFGHPRLSQVASKIVAGARDGMDQRSLGALIEDLEREVDAAVERTSQNDFQPQG